MYMFVCGKFANIGDCQNKNDQSSADFWKFRPKNYLFTYFQILKVK